MRKGPDSRRTAIVLKTAGHYSELTFDRSKTDPHILLRQQLGLRPTETPHLLARVEHRGEVLLFVTGKAADSGGALDFGGVLRNKHCVPFDEVNAAEVVGDILVHRIEPSTKKWKSLTLAEYKDIAIDKEHENHLLKATMTAAASSSGLPMFSHSGGYDVLAKMMPPRIPPMPASMKSPTAFSHAIDATHWTPAARAGLWAMASPLPWDSTAIGFTPDTEMRGHLSEASRMLQQIRRCDLLSDLGSKYI